MLSKRTKAIAWAVIFVLPFVIGFVGYLPIHEYHLSWAAYSSIRLYAANVDTYEMNILVDIARWSALLVVASSFWMVVKSASGAIMNYWRSFGKDSCAVYGDSLFAGQLLKNLAKNGIASTGKVIHGAKRHVLLFDTDDENIAF